jgi:hypothetical protein
MDFNELLPGSAALDTNGVTQALVTVCHLRVDSKKTPQVDFTLSLDLQGFERDPADGALRHVPHRYAGIQRGDQMLLRIGKPVRATEFAGLIDIDREPARQVLPSDREPLHLGASSSLALPARSCAPGGGGFRDIALDTLDQGEEVVDAKAVNDLSFDGLCIGIHIPSPSTDVDCL